MTAITTTWTQRDTVSFTAGTITSISDCVTQVQNALHRGPLSSSTTPTSTQVQQFLIRGKQKLIEKFGFSWRRKYVYASTAAGTWQYALPADFGGGATVLREITSSDSVLTFYDVNTFPHLFPDVAGSDNAIPSGYTIKDRELWLSSPADGTYTLELEYPRTGDDSTASDVSYLPEIARFKICDYALYRSYLLLQNWEMAQIYKAEWQSEINDAKEDESHRKWASMGYMAKNWHYYKI